MSRSGLIPQAHTYGARADLPIPLYLFVVGGALVVLLSFLLVLRRRAVPAAPVEAVDTVPTRPFRVISGGLSILVTGLVAVVGLTGTQETATNIAPLFFWVLLWIVVPVSCGLLGDWTQSVNPFANAARLGDSPGVRKLVLARNEPLEWSARLAWWPAVALFVLLVLGELVFNLRTTQPSFVGGVLIVYGVLSFFLGLLFGESWMQRGEVFSGLFNAWGRLGFLRYRSPGRRGFAGGLDVPFEASPSRIVFVLLMLVSINFDGLLATPQWARYERSTFGTDINAVETLRTLSLVALVVLVLAVFLGFARESAKLGGHRAKPLASLAVLLPSLVPIAYGYLIAHNLQYLVTNLQFAVPLSVNPGYESWPIHLSAPFDIERFEVERTVLPNGFYWYFSLVAIVVVHVIAVLLAHRQLAARGVDERSALRSEYPWLIAMVGYTVFSLYLIAQPLVEAGQ